MVKLVFCMERLKTLTEQKTTPSGSLFRIFHYSSQKKKALTPASVVCFTTFVLMTYQHQLNQKQVCNTV